MKFIAGFLYAVVLLGIAGVAYVYSGGFDVAASPTQHLGAMGAEYDDEAVGHNGSQHRW